MITTCYVCGTDLDTEEAHSYHAEGCPWREADPFDPDFTMDGCYDLSGCNEDVHPGCCPTCNPPSTERE